jgi:hypothetical protein
MGIDEPMPSNCAQVVDFPHIARGKRKMEINSKVAKGAKERD